MLVAMVSAAFNVPEQGLRTWVKRSFRFSRSIRQKWGPMPPGRQTQFAAGGGDSRP